MVGYDHLRSLLVDRGSFDYDHAETVRNSGVEDHGRELYPAWQSGLILGLRCGNRDPRAPNACLYGATRARTRVKSR